MISCSFLQNLFSSFLWKRGCLARDHISQPPLQQGVATWLVPNNGIWMEEMWATLVSLALEIACPGLSLFPLFTSGNGSSDPDLTVWMRKHPWGWQSYKERGFLDGVEWSCPTHQVKEKWTCILFTILLISSWWQLSMYPKENTSAKSTGTPFPEIIPIIYSPHCGWYWGVRLHKVFL